ncbi:MAG: hypothetical protein LC637_12595 [Xanthomonadaceae bacterium]|nr:hypothetical protein [Xanthomonadaceae bacterium]
MSIQMGNDEFILYTRKNFKNCHITNDQLGKTIWHWLQENDPTSEIIERGQPCMWGSSEVITSEMTLPKTAAQFQFSITILPQLYAFLGKVGACEIS